MALTISIIVPIYNSEKTIRSCVDSLLVQGLEEGSYEIILINDGSTDLSKSICEEYSESYPFIRVITTDNSGLSNARNKGIELAKGLFLCFVDADDTLVPSGLASMIPLCDGNVDLIRYWCTVVFDGKVPSNVPHANINFKGTGHDYLKQFGLESFCWNFLYRRSFIMENSLYFIPGIIGEDYSFMFDVMKSNPRIVSVSARLYNYFIHRGSITANRTAMHSRRWVKDSLGTLIRIIAELQVFRERDPDLYDRCRESLDERMIPFFSRILSSHYSVSEFRNVVHNCRENGLLPFQSSASSRKMFLCRVLINMVITFPFLYPIFSRIYTMFFLPYFHHWIY